MIHLSNIQYSKNNNLRYRIEEQITDYFEEGTQSAKQTTKYWFLFKQI